MPQDITTDSLVTPSLTLAGTANLSPPAADIPVPAADAPLLRLQPGSVKLPKDAPLPATSVRVAKTPNQTPKQSVSPAQTFLDLSVPNLVAPLFAKPVSDAGGIAGLMAQAKQAVTTSPEFKALAPADATAVLQGLDNNLYSSVAAKMAAQVPTPAPEMTEDPGFKVDVAGRVTAPDKVVGKDPVAEALRTPEPSSTTVTSGMDQERNKVYAEHVGALGAAKTPQERALAEANLDLFTQNNPGYKDAASGAKESTSSQLVERRQSTAAETRLITLQAKQSPETFTDDGTTTAGEAGAKIAAAALADKQNSAEAKRKIGATRVAGIEKSYGSSPDPVTKALTANARVYGELLDSASSDTEVNMYSAELTRIAGDLAGRDAALSAQEVSKYGILTYDGHGNYKGVDVTAALAFAAFGLSTYQMLVLTPEEAQKQRDYQLELAMLQFQAQKKLQKQQIEGAISVKEATAGGTQSNIKIESSAPVHL
jgi:hypothetical protein